MNENKFKITLNGKNYIGNLPTDEGARQIFYTCMYPRMIVSNTRDKKYHMEKCVLHETCLACYDGNEYLKLHLKLSYQEGTKVPFSLL